MQKRKFGLVVHPIKSLFSWHLISVWNVPTGKTGQPFLIRSSVSPGNYSLKQPKSHVPFTFGPEFREMFCKWKTLLVSKPPISVPNTIFSKSLFPLPTISHNCLTLSVFLSLRDDPHCYPWMQKQQQQQQQQNKQNKTKKKQTDAKMRAEVDWHIQFVKQVLLNFQLSAYSLSCCVSNCVYSFSHENMTFDDAIIAWLKVHSDNRLSENWNFF